MGSLILDVDPNCSTTLGGPSDPDCGARSSGLEGTPTSPSLALNVVVGASVGGVIVIQLTMIIVIVLVVVYRRWRKIPIRCVLCVLCMCCVLCVLCVCVCVCVLCANEYVGVCMYA